MNQTVAKYLFFNETLYKNVEIETVVENQIPVANSQQPIANSQQPITNSQQPTANSQQQIANSQQPFKVKHKVLILVDKMQEEHREFLGKILVAVGLSYEQVDLVEISKNSVGAYQKFIAEKITHQLISFGVGMGKLDFNLILKPYEIKHIEGVDFLLVDSLDIIAQDLHGEKRKLWVLLKSLFQK